MYDSQSVFDAYATVNGLSAANEIDDLIYGAVAKYMNLNDYSVGAESDRIAVGTTDVLRLTADGEFKEYGFRRNKMI
jgi:hypothetical protein